MSAEAIQSIFRGHVAPPKRSFPRGRGLETPILARLALSTLFKWIIYMVEDADFAAYDGCRARDYTIFK